jgi:hypothetical protein
MTTSRRRVLGSLGAAASLALAGCSSGGGGDNGGPTREDAPAQFRLDGTTLNLSTPVRLVDANSGEMVVRIHGHGETTHWHRSPLVLQVGQWQRYEIQFQDFDGEPIPLGEGEQYRATVSLVDDADFVEYEHAGMGLDLRGTEAGGASLQIDLVSDGESQWTPPPLSMSVRG